MAFALPFRRTKRPARQESAEFGAVAERLRRAGDLEGAVALCRDGLERFPSLLSARVTLGTALLALGHPHEARAEFEQVIKQAPDNLLAVRGLAQVHGAGQSNEYRGSGYSSPSSTTQPAGFWGGSEGQHSSGGRQSAEPISHGGSHSSDDEDYAHSLEALKNFEQEQEGDAIAAEPALAAGPLLTPPPIADPTLLASALSLSELSEVAGLLELPELQDVSATGAGLEPAESWQPHILALPPVNESIEVDSRLPTSTFASAPLLSVTDPDLLAYDSALPCPEGVVLLVDAA